MCRCKICNLIVVMLTMTMTLFVTVYAVSLPPTSLVYCFFCFFFIYHTAKKRVLSTLLSTVLFANAL